MLKFILTNGLFYLHVKDLIHPLEIKLFKSESITNILKIKCFLISLSLSFQIHF